jgi:RNA polymerase sigma-70 factor, ECF subfamily
MADPVLDFDALVEEHASRVFNLAFRITGNRQDAEDVAQETFLKVHQGLPGFRGESELSTWIHRIALNAALKVKRKIGDEASLDGLEDRITAMRDDVPAEVRRWLDDPSQAVLARALLTEINQGCLHFMTFRLTDEQRAAWVLCRILDFSLEEAAETLETSVNVVKSRLHRARAKLEKYFTARCPWLADGAPGCSCESRVGFAIAMDPEIIRRARMRALASAEEATYAGFLARQVQTVEDLYGTLPRLRYKTEAVKAYLHALALKNDGAPVT